MFKSTLQQIFLFLVTLSLVYFTGKHLMSQNGLESFLDFGVGMVFFFSFIFFMNYFLRLSSKVVSSIGY
ncbi:hypothetical protein [Polaribacter dokdonensis]|jgi:hypothetical protein|uniref:Uncharacterized protein n=1 Tax=Polaribacter dokdonensis DSW-5 TaxID=1300348 RepID=A0A0N1IY90_9FLAO|nr:hypothetical protein [Polaribacter dokdonensis]KOY52917.1 hypothetical protein I602_2477 [Polaribacter dokdonensis DSW-5]SEE54395.1 hypothetical protein SAMN05444353_2251 [Polaribacter dokdonensis DSW-5]